MQEFELIQQLQKGNKSAFRTLVEIHKDRVYNTCLGCLRHPHDTEDIAQVAREEIAQARVESLAGLIGQIQVRLDQATYRHLKEVRRLSTPEQKQRFHKVIDMVMARIKPDKGYVREKKTV